MSAFTDERQGTARYLQALGQHWPFIAGSVALAIGAAILYLATAESRYDAHADVLVTPVAVNDATFVGLPVIRESGEARTVLTVARLVETPQVADNVRRQLRLRATRDELFDSVRVDPQEQSNIVTITGESASAEEAAAIANAFAAGVISERTRVFQRQLEQIVTRLSRRLADLPATSRGEGEGRALADRLGELRGLIGAQDPTLQIASRAVPPSEPSWPRPLLSLIAAGFIGLVLGVGIAIAIELLNPLVIRDEDILEEHLVLLARVPRTSPRDMELHLGGEALADEVKDAYRLARVNLKGAGANPDEPRTILVTSTARREGKTTAAINIALAYAQAGSRVVLVDGDMRRAHLTEVFGAASDTSTLGDVLLEAATVEDSLVPARAYGDRLRLLTAGAKDGEAVDLLASWRIESLVEELKSNADVVIFDSPPIAEVPDALTLATTVDAVVLVVRYGRTRREKIAYARLLLGQLAVVPAGVIAVTRRRVRARRGIARAEPAGEALRPAPSSRHKRKRSRPRARSSSGST